MFTFPLFKNRCYFIPLIIFSFAIVALPVFAEVGVGVGIGKINLGTTLEPGGVYPLPQIPVVNDGTEVGEFGIRAEGVNGPVALKKDQVAGWFNFSPASFNLDPKSSVQVTPTLSLPLSVPQGEYLVYLEAYPVLERTEANVQIMPAAATKLYFGVNSGSVLGAVRNRVLTWILYRSELYLIFAALLLLEAGLILKRNFEVKIRPRSDQSQTDDQEESRYKFG